MRSFLYELAIRAAGRGYRSQYSEIRDVTSSNSLSEFIREKLTDLLIHAYNSTAYYREVLSDLDILDGGKVNLENFSRIPILKKDIIRKRFSELLSRDYQTSGGSTDEPVKVVQDRYYSAWVRAMIMYYYGDMLGIDKISAKEVILWDSLKDVLKGSSLKSKVDSGSRILSS